MKIRMQKTLLMLLSVLIMLNITCCGNKGNEDTDANLGKEITLPHDSSYYEGTEKPVINIVDELEALGFRNINTIEDDKGINYFKVNSVKICKNNSKKFKSFKEGDVFYANNPIEIHYYGNAFEDGMIHKTDIFEFEKYIKNLEGIIWSNEHTVTEGISGYLGTLMNEDQTIHINLYANDLKEITSAYITTSSENIDIIKMFASYFNTEFIDQKETEKWLDESLIADKENNQIFGDAEFYISPQYDTERKLTITAL